MKMAENIHIFIYTLLNYLIFILKLYNLDLVIIIYKMYWIGSLS